MSFDLTKNILLLARSGEKKRETAKHVKRFAFAIGLDRALAGANRLDGVGKPGKHVGLRDGDIVRSENQFQLRRERRQALYRIDVGVEIGLRTVEPDRGGIIRVAREKKAVGAIEQRDGVRRVARRGKNFQGAAAQVDLEAFVNKARNLPGLRGVRFWIKSLWQIAAELIRRNFRMGILARTFRIRAREAGVRAVDKIELPVAADVIVVSVRVEHDDETRRQLGSNFADVADAHAGVEEKRLLVADNEIRNGFFRLMRFVNGENAGRHSIDFEPRIARKHAFERFVFRARKRAAPFGLLGLWGRWKRKT